MEQARDLVSNLQIPSGLDAGAAKIVDLRARVQRLLPGPPNKWVWAALLFVAVIGTLWVFRAAVNAKNAADPDWARRTGNPIPVRTAPVIDGDFDTVISATGVAMASERAEIKIGASRFFKVNDPISELRIKKVNVGEGDPVRKDQVVIELEEDIFKKWVKQQESALNFVEAELERVKQANALNERIRKLDLDTAESGLKFRKADMDNRETIYKKAQGLFKNIGVSEVELFEAQSRFISAQFEFTNAQFYVQRAKDNILVGRLSDKKDLSKATNDVTTMQLELDIIRKDAERCHLRSPVNGYVGKTELVPNTIVGLHDLLLYIYQVDPIQVRVDFPQERLDDIATGQAAEVVFDSFPKETFAGTVIRISPIVDPNLRVLPVVVELGNPKGRIRPGLSAFVRFRSVKKTTGVPAVSILSNNGRTVVFRVEDGRAKLTEIRTGHLIENGLMEVRDGLKAGDEVVIFHNFYRHSGELSTRNCYLQDNDRVDTDWRKWTRRG